MRMREGPISQQMNLISILRTLSLRKKMSSPYHIQDISRGCLSPHTGSRDAEAAE